MVQRVLSRSARVCAAILVGLLALGMTPQGLTAQATGPSTSGQVPGATELRFEISYPDSIRSEPVTGRVYVMITRRPAPEPRFQIGRSGVPLFGRDVESLAPGQPAVIDASDLGSPVESLSEIPPGEYYVQAFVNVYERFERADGHVVWMPEDHWEGQRWERSPGNLYSEVRRVRLDPQTGYVVHLEANHVIAPVEIPRDTRYVKRFRFQSPMLSEFWGRPIYLGATILLPRDYDRETVTYPVLYHQDHFSLRPPLGFREGTELYEAWMRDDFPRMIVVTFQHPNPYFDDSYAVNSVNVGPYADAIMQELIPEVERRFRVIREPWARFLDGGSTGGWEALALQLFHPDFFGGTWAYCPDPVTFTNVESINIYEDENAFYKQYEWRRVPTPNTRETDGRIRLTSEQRNRWELVNGTRGRSSEQLDAWSAVYGPLGEDGYFKPLFDKRTGMIDPEVAAYWREHYDLLHHLQRNWSTLGPKLVDKLHIYTGDMDSYYLNVAVQELEAWMATTEDPHYPGFFMYGDGKGHGWSGPLSTAERLKEMASHALRHMPEDRTAPWWRY
jgi:hypothetical protein